MVLVILLSFGWSMYSSALSFTLTLSYFCSRSRLPLGEKSFKEISLLNLVRLGDGELPWLSLNLLRLESCDWSMWSGESMEACEY